MFKKSLITLALAAGALWAAPASAAIVSLDFSSLLHGGSKLQGTASWDSASAPYDSGMGGAIQYYAFQSHSLFLDGKDLLGSFHTVSQFLVVEKSGTMDYVGLYLSADQGPAALGIEDFLLRLDFRAGPDGLVASTAAPSSLDFINKSTSTNMSVSARDANTALIAGLAVASLTSLAATPDNTGNTGNTVPEPGSLLLTAGAGLALVAARRRQPLAAKSF